MRLDGQSGALSNCRQLLQRARGAVHEIANSVDVEDNAVLPIRIDEALELADDWVANFRIALWRWCAWHTAIASASAASSERGSAFGSSTEIIIRTCAFSPCPTPTMVFFTRLGAYSETGTPAIAGTSMATPRACPNFRVAEASLLTKVASTAASSGACLSTMALKPRWIARRRS